MWWLSDRRISMPWRKVCFAETASMYCSCLMCFFMVLFLTPLAFLKFLSDTSKMEYIFGPGRHILRFGAQRTHPSFFSTFCLNLPSSFLRTSLMSTCLRRFSIVLPNTEFFISLYRAFSNPLVALFRSSVFIWM